VRRLALLLQLAGMCSIAPAQNYIIQSGAGGRADLGEGGRAAEGRLNNPWGAASGPGAGLFATELRDNRVPEVPGGTASLSTGVGSPSGECFQVGWFSHASIVKQAENGSKRLLLFDQRIVRTLPRRVDGQSPMCKSGSFPLRHPAPGPGR
jgi:hypothetical protein